MQWPGDASGPDSWEVRLSKLEETTEHKLVAATLQIRTEIASSEERQVQLLTAEREERQWGLQELQRGLHSQQRQCELYNNFVTTLQQAHDELTVRLDLAVEKLEGQFASLGSECQSTKERLEAQVLTVRTEVLNMSRDVLLGTDQRQDESLVTRAEVMSVVDVRMR